jgi:L-lactate utilization protein LutC
MTIDEVQEMIAPVETLQERVAKRRMPEVITTYSQHYGNRITSHFYPEHWAQVQLARATMHRWREA